jgi:rubrerythrin
MAARIEQDDLGGAERFRAEVEKKRQAKMRKLEKSKRRDGTVRRPADCRAGTDPQKRALLSYECPICGATAQQGSAATQGIAIVCPVCGEYEISTSVLTAGQLRKLE